MNALFSFGRQGDAVMHSEFMAFAHDEASLQELRMWAERQGYPQAAAQNGGVDMFAHMLEAAPPPKMAIVDLDGQSDAAAVTARLTGMCGGDCKIIMIGSANDVALYRRVLNAGAVDYLVKPLNADMLNQAFAAALRGAVGGKAEAKEARLAVFIGARGGVGASTVALNCGWLLAHELRRHVVLLDLDLQFGSSALALDLEPGRGLRDILSSPQRVDALMIASSIIPESEHFSVLSAEEAVDEVVTMDGGAITALIKEIKNNFDHIVVDLPRYQMAQQKRLLAAAHDIVIVSDLTLAGIRDTLRIKTALNALGCGAAVTLVAARVNAAGIGHIDSAVFEKGVQGKIDFTIAEDSVAAAGAANAGKALSAAAPRAAFTKSLRLLAEKMAHIEAREADKKPFWAKRAWLKIMPKDKAGKRP